MNNQLSFISLGGIGEVTKNLYVYEYDNELLLVDCGLGFADETMIGVDLLLPDVSYLIKAVQNGKKIIGMVLSHGHEDHIGALPFVLPQLPEFPIYATNFTSALANEKLKQFGLKPAIKETPFGQDVQIGTFTCTFFHVTHSVPDTSHIFIKTPVGNFYHGSDFKFDFTPFDGKKTDFQAIAKAGTMGIRCLLSDSLGSERPGYTPSEEGLTAAFEQEMRNCQGRFIVTTYSSNISRLNQIIAVAEKLNKSVCFVGRSLIKAKDIARARGLLTLKKEREIQIDQLKRHNDRDILLFVAGSQGQENSALTRIVTGEHRDVHLRASDVVVFSADPIPGNEVSINALIDNLSQMGIRVMYSGITHNFHVSGHGSQQELLLLMSLAKAKQVLPISGSYKHMAAYKELAEQFGYAEKDILLTRSGQEIIFTKETTTLGQKIPLRHIYVDNVSGEEVEQYVLRDRQKISAEGIVALIVEVDAENGSVVNKPEVVVRGFAAKEVEDVSDILVQTLKKSFPGGKPVNDWTYMRKKIREVAEKKIAEVIKRQPLVLPVVIEV